MQPALDPYLEPLHRELARKTRDFGNHHLRAGGQDEAEPNAATRNVLQRLAGEGLLAPAVLPPHGAMDTRSLVSVREALAYFSAMADAAFAMQGLGSHPISLAGSEAQIRRWLPAVVAGEVACALALSEPEAGSNLLAIRTAAERDGSVWRLSGVKTFISNAGIAGLLTVLARSSDAEGPEALSMFLVDAEAPGISVRPLEPMAPRPLGEIRFEGTPGLLLGKEGNGHVLATTTLDTFRPSAAAAACGLAHRALEEAVRWALSRRQSGRFLSELPSIQMSLAEMDADLMGARLLVHHAAWVKDLGAAKVPREGAMAKLVAAEMAQRVVDRAVQIHGAHGLMKGATVERLYREVRAVRIHEGTSEIQKLEIANQLIKESR